MENTNVELFPYDKISEVISKRQSEIDALRLDGVTKLENLRNENSNIKRNKQLDKETKSNLISSNKEKMLEAKNVRDEHKDEVSEKVKELTSIIKENYKAYINEKKASNKKSAETFKAQYEADVVAENERYANAVSETNASFSGDDLKGKTKDLLLQHKQLLNDLKVVYHDKLDKCKDELHQLYLEKSNAIEEAHNKRLPFADNISRKWENYKYNFSGRQFVLNNGLYLAIIFLLICSAIYYGIQNGSFILNLDTILLILQQTSPKIFLALGVAGLIVLAGTDLSVGRLVGLASVLTGMLITTSGTTSLTFFGNVHPDFSSMPLGGRVVLAFVISIVACVVISSIAGFFSARFKMHPFISTLATQLFTFGLLAGMTGNSFTGAPDLNIQKILTGYIGDSRFSIMIIWAIIAIVVMWFIWNKTTFGKNIFAVGGNPEAASVSGINVFRVTLLVFVLAGIYYGIGGSIFGIYSGNVRAQTGQGMETDAIAACVVGGVSFTGGVGKIRGVVIGALLFQAITVILPYIGIYDANYQLAIKGVIVLAAVALDCAKYLKKK